MIFYFFSFACDLEYFINQLSQTPCKTTVCFKEVLDVDCYNEVEEELKKFDQIDCNNDRSNTMYKRSTVSDAVSIPMPTRRKPVKLQRKSLWDILHSKMPTLSVKSALTFLYAFLTLCSLLMSGYSTSVLVNNHFKSYHFKKISCNVNIQCKDDYLAPFEVGESYNIVHHRSGRLKRNQKFFKSLLYAKRYLDINDNIVDGPPCYLQVRQGGSTFKGNPNLLQECGEISDAYYHTYNSDYLIVPAFMGIPIALIFGGLCLFSSEDDANKED